MLAGLALATLSFWSAAARRRMAVFGPPGGVGEEGRPEEAPTGELTGEEGRGDDWQMGCQLLVPRKASAIDWKIWGWGWGKGID